jgi:hypothetical protein
MTRSRRMLALFVAAWVAALMMDGCTNAVRRAGHVAQQAGLGDEIIQGTHFRHQIFRTSTVEYSRLYVFLDGDGYPYSRRGTRASIDPTPRHPLALQLAAQTPAAVLYVARPCSFMTLHDPGCDASLWTSARYSADVAASMSGAVNRVATAHNTTQVLLIGYSGGGTLALLMAPQIEHLVGVVTIAANLDTDAWTQWHGYLPLTGSLNPARMPSLPSGILQWHLAGDRDTNTPPRLNDSYWARVPSDHVWHYVKFDHICCWAQQWPSIFQRIQAALGP